MVLNETPLLRVICMLQVDDYLCDLPVKALPGIGRALEERLKKRQVKTCGQLRLISKVFFFFFKF